MRGRAAGAPHLRGGGPPPRGGGGAANRRERSRSPVDGVRRNVAGTKIRDIHEARSLPPQSRPSARQHYQHDAANQSRKLAGKFHISSSPCRKFNSPLVRTDYVLADFYAESIAGSPIFSRLWLRLAAVAARP